MPILGQVRENVPVKRRVAFPGLGGNDFSVDNTRSINPNAAALHDLEADVAVAGQFSAPANSGGEQNLDAVSLSTRAHENCGYHYSTAPVLFCLPFPPYFPRDRRRIALGAEALPLERHLLFEPGHLALGKLTGFLFHQFDGLGQGACPG